MAGARSEIGQPVPVVAAPLPSLAPAGVAEQAADAAAAAAATTAPYPVDAQRPLPTPFLTKTYQLVEDTAIDDVISWNEDGSTFVVWRPAEFARDLLPQYFKHNNFSSFVRQLNTYGFKKIVPDRWEFANDCFRRGEKQLLCDIHRRKVHPPAAVPAIPMAIPVAIPACGVASPTNSADEQVLSRTSSPVAAPSTSGRVSGGASPELVEENNWLRKENERLNQELSQMKSLCNNIVVLMSKHAGQLQLQQQQLDGGGCPQAAAAAAAAAEKPTPPPSPLELMPLIRCSSESESGDGRVKMEEGRRSPSPRLFGVPIGLKRGRAVEGEDASAATAPEEQLAEVKPEPVDLIAVDSPPDQNVHHHYRWRLYRPRRANHRVCN